MIGTSIGKYEIISEIGRGGMGIVYLGHQKSLDRPVAIKVLPPQLASDSNSVSRFIKEAELIMACSFSLKNSRNFFFKSFTFIKN